MRIIRVKDLIAYIESEAYLKSTVVPISLRRAYSHANNPRAHPDDIALLLIYDQDELVAYLGALPDLVWINGQPQKMAWLSCLWVNPRMRGRALVKPMMETAINFYHQQIIVTGYIPGTKKIYDRLGYFEEQMTPTGIKGHLRPNLRQILPPKSERWARLKPLWQVLDAFGSVVNNIRLLFYSCPMPAITVIDLLDEEAETFLAHHNLPEACRRDVSTLNWIIQYPWIRQAGTPDQNETRYYFSSIAPQFANFVFKIHRPNGTLNGLVVLSIRDGHLKLVYAQLNDDALDTAAKAIYAYALQSGANRVTIVHTQLATYIQQDKAAPFYLKRAYQHRYLVSRRLHLPEGAIFQDGDGDAAFT